MNKVAQVTIFFWIMKILATTLGETAGDFVSMTLGLGYYIAFAVTFSILAIVLFTQIRARKYRPMLYWAAIIATTTAGTEVSDLMDRSLGLGYAVGSLVLVTGLIATLTIWYYRDRDISVYPITRKDAETTYWIAIVFSNSLGTAFGDFLTSNLGLSYIQGAMVTAGVIAVVVLLHYGTALSETLLFWLAFIFTRPFGATFGDFITKPIQDGGLNLPREYASIAALILMISVLVISTKFNLNDGSKETLVERQTMSLVRDERAPAAVVGEDDLQSDSDSIARALVRVPAVTLYFWIIKVLATTVGETGADYLAFTLKLGLVTTSYIMAALLAVVLVNQFGLKRYVPANYWLAVVLVSIVGTLITDLMVDQLGVSLIAATVGFSLALVGVFIAWYLSEGSLAMHSIRTARRETFYWLAILFTFALGTAAGDLLSESSGLGYFQAALVFGGAIALVAAAYYRFEMNEILAFWLAYILTRPLGASTGDLLSQPGTHGGLGFGTVGTSIIFLTTILLLIGYLSITRKDQICSGQLGEPDRAPVYRR